MTGFYITISNGLLKDGHRKRMGASVWEFMWLIDKITRIDTEGCGVVLGGKPIKLEDIAREMGVHKETVGENLKNLEVEGYIEKKIAPYGIIITVTKAQKRFGKNTVPVDERYSQNTVGGTAKTLSRYSQNTVRNKTIQDNTIDNTLSPPDVGEAKSVSYKKKNKDGKAPPPHHAEAIELIMLYNALFEKFISKTKPIFNMGQAIKMARLRIASLGGERMKELLNTYIDSNDPFYKENVYSITCFLSEKVINKLNLTTKHGK